jgi:geranylgeranyl diphosphate synthase type II
MTLDARMETRRAQVERALDQWLPAATREPRRLHESMRYSVLAGGKRLRPVLLLEACAAVGGEEAHALPAACALELIHTYSLVHDDLPCMDDDDLRRGKPTNHKVFGEALALLCGDALLTHAFLLLAREQVAAGVPTAVAAEVAAIVAEAAGSGGMVGGQAVDMGSERKSVGAETVEYIHRHKTAALLRAAVESGALLGGADPAARAGLTTYGAELGLAFQITDDLLDIESSEEALGKRPRQDEQLDKATYPKVYGVARSRQLARQSVSRAKAALECLGANGAILSQLADHVVERTG